MAGGTCKTSFRPVTFWPKMNKICIVLPEYIKISILTVFVDFLMNKIFLAKSGFVSLCPLLSGNFTPSFGKILWPVFDIYRHGSLYRPTYVGVWVQKYRSDWRYCRYKLLHVETCANTSGQIDFTWMIFRVYGWSLIFLYS
jgi:hypothetical protein